MKKRSNAAGQIDLFRPMGVKVQDALRVFGGGKIVYQGPALNPTERQRLIRIKK